MNKREDFFSDKRIRKILARVAEERDVDVEVVKRIISSALRASRAVQRATTHNIKNLTPYSYTIPGLGRFKASTKSLLNYHYRIEEEILAGIRDEEGNICVDYDTFLKYRYGEYGSAAEFDEERAERIRKRQREEEESKPVSWGNHI